LRDAFDASMDAVPRQIDAKGVQAYLAGQPGVTAVHHLHIWSLGTGEVAMTAHLVRSASDDHDAFLDRVVHALDERFGINHPTLQVEHGACGHDRHDAAPHGRSQVPVPHAH
jgi:cobalt-zinc-cadmium efflux system protein